MLFGRPREIGLGLDANSPNIYCGLTDASGVITASKYSITNNFPIQTWVSIIISVDNTNLDMYLNGQLIQTQLLSKPITPPTDSGSLATDGIYFGTGDIYLANLKRFSTPLNPQDAYNIYSQGNGQNWLSSYNVNFAILKNTVVKHSLTL